MHIRDILYPESSIDKGCRMPGFAYIHSEMAKPGVNLTLLWREYCEQCQSEKAIPYQYTQFCEHYKALCAKQKRLCESNANLVNSWRLIVQAVPFLLQMLLQVNVSRHMFLWQHFHVVFTVMQRPFRQWLWKTGLLHIFMHTSFLRYHAHPSTGQP